MSSTIENNAISVSAAFDAKISATQLSSTTSTDLRYCYDATALQKLKSSKPWMKDPKYFKSVAVSPSAVIKIMMHCQSGVDKGIAKGGNPIEVMGILLGRPDPITPTTLIVTDAFPLPIEGFETRVVADDDNVVNHMITLGESLERTRNEKFMGWYHSHPFDYIVDRGHCFLSQTDLSTQLQWQRAEDPHGNPFVAIVVDPLRSVIQQNPELKAFRAYPPEYNSPITNECPDGTIETIERLRLEKWGSCWNRYYELNVEYFMSQVSRNVLETMTQDYLWIRTFNSISETKITEGLDTTKKQFYHAHSTKNNQQQSSHQQQQQQQQSQSIGSGGGSTSRETPYGTNPETTITITTTTSEGPSVETSTGVISNVKGVDNPRTMEWNKAVTQLTEVANKQMAEVSIQSIKQHIFS